MMCSRCNIDMAVREVTHELLKTGEEITLSLVQTLCCKKCDATKVIKTPMPMTVKNA